jgi:uncharacterized protein involved in exopolysaccharide biosynthesis
MSKTPSAEYLKNQISINDIVNFFKKSWKLIICFTILGLLISVITIKNTAIEYKSTIQIQTARVLDGDIYSIKYKNIEQINELISRLRTPSNYSSELIEACSIDQKNKTIEAVLKNLKFSTIKANESVMNVEIVMSSKEQLNFCAQAIFEYVEDSQKKIIEPLLERYKKKIIDNQFRLNQIKSSLSNKEKDKVMSLSEYMVAKDEINSLREENKKIDNLLYSVEKLKTKIYSPTYIHPKSVYPKRDFLLISGLLLGLIIGILFSFTWKKLKGK